MTEEGSKRNAVCTWGARISRPLGARVAGCVVGSVEVVSSAVYQRVRISHFKSGNGRDVLYLTVTNKWYSFKCYETNSFADISFIIDKKRRNNASSCKTSFFDVLDSAL